MQIDLARLGPAQPASRFRSCRSLERASPEKVDKKVEAPRGHAPNLVPSDGPQVAGAIAGLLEELAPRGVLERLVALDVPAGQEPCPSERTGGLFDDEDPPGAIDARDDRTYPRPLGHPR